MKIHVEETIAADIDLVWEAATDVASWPAWDPHEDDARIDGPFAEGTKGWSKPHGAPAADWVLTKVVEKQSWASECPLPGGKLLSESTFDDLGDGTIACAKTMWVSGPLVPLFRVYFAPKIRKDMARSLRALEAESNRRATANGSA